MKLSKKQGMEIAKLFNALSVADMMYHNPNPTTWERRSEDERTQYKRRWHASIREARDALKAMGIPVIGYDHY